MKLAFVVQRYGLEINGGAELHCRWVAEHLKKYAEVEVLTTRAADYITWKNSYSRDEEDVNGIRVRRFPVIKARDPQRFGRLQDWLLRHEHRESDELRWLDEEGPRAPALIQYLKDNASSYDYFFFFSYRYYHSYWGVKTVPRRSILVPTAERDPVVGLRIFQDLFRTPRAIVYNSVEERKMINDVSGNHQVPGDVVGVGTEVPGRYSGEAFRRKHKLPGPYVLYLGRIDENKGCHKLFEYFIRFKRESGSEAKLVLAGSTVIQVPSHPDIHYLGFLGDVEKFDALDGAELLVMPSFYESLSMVTLEAWALGKPVLANALCDVLKGQCLRSNGGLYYETYPEFREALSLLLGSPRLRGVLGENGRRYFEANYAWDVIENKYLDLISRMEKEKGA
ncbi:MAG: hexosyltransferase [Candidatus Aminicenantes bacterium RBG_19FT_COMBO_59_29]|nr:MAG: hexosyltransferase [Candidatus Aminicenantes bacterium RBG_19FT_COMBO_59_29]